jgi:outer membrane lipoprotein-sorting protein
LAASTAVTLLMTGCISEMPSDITLDELEQKMAQAMDPQREYRKARAYFQRQNITETALFGTKLQLVEVKFQRPDKFKLSYYDDRNRIASEVLSKDGKAWLIDYKKGKIIPIEGQTLEKFKVMLALGHPDTDFDKIFSDVKLSLHRRINGNLYYKLVCQPRIAGSYPIIIYIDKQTMLPESMELKVKTAGRTVESTCNIVEYRKFGTLTLPALTEVEDGIREYTNRVVDYQLNSGFSGNEFKLPVFDPVVIESNKIFSR